MKYKKIIKVITLISTCFASSYADDLYKPSDVSVYVQGSNVANQDYSDIQKKGYEVLWGMFFGDKAVTTNPITVNDLYIWLNGGDLIAQPSYVNSATANGKIEVVLGGNAGQWGKEPFNTTSQQGVEDFITLCGNIISTVGMERLAGIDLDLEWTSAFSWSIEDWDRLASAIIEIKKAYPGVKIRATVPTSTWSYRVGYRNMKNSAILQEDDVFDNINIMVMDAATKHPPSWYQDNLNATIEYLGLNTRDKNIITPVFSWESNPSDNDFIEVAKSYSAEGYHKLALWQGNLSNKEVVDKIDLVASGSPMPPQPKPTNNYDLQVTDTDTNLGMIVNIKSADNASFTSDYINPKDHKVYNNNTSPASSSIMDKNDLKVTWSTYVGGPEGACSGSLDYTKRMHIMINPTTKACEISAY